MTQDREKTKTELLRELESIQGLLDDDDIPMLSEVIEKLEPENSEIHSTMDDRPLSADEYQSLRSAYDSLKQEVAEEAQLASTPSAPNPPVHDDSALSYNSDENKQSYLQSSAAPLDDVSDTPQFENTDKPDTLIEEENFELDNFELDLGAPTFELNDAAAPYQPAPNSEAAPVRSEGQSLPLPGQQALFSSADTKPEDTATIDNDEAVENDRTIDTPVSESTNTATNFEEGVEPLPQATAPSSSTAIHSDTASAGAAVKPSGENPFLPQHIRERLRGNRAGEFAGAAPLSPREYNRGQLVNELIDSVMPELESALRLKLAAMSDEQIKKLLND